MCENNLSYADLIKLVTLVTASRDRELFGVDNDLCNRYCFHRTCAFH